MSDTLEAPDELPLVGVAEVAAILGIDRRHVYDLTRFRDWPEPLARFTTGSVWRASDIHQWLRSHAESTSRPGSEGGFDHL